MNDIISNKASKPGRTSFYDFSMLGSNGGQNAPAGLQTEKAGGNGAASGGNTAAPAANGGTAAGGTGVATNGASVSATNAANDGAASGGATASATAEPDYAKQTVKNYEDMERIIRERMNELPPGETKEQREKRERREKHMNFLSRLADGLGSFHTTFAYARGEKPMDMPQMSKKATELYEKQKAAREKNRDQRMNYAINIANLGNEKVKALREIAAQQEAQRLAREKAKREQEEHGWKAEEQPYKLKEQKGKATTAEQKAITAGEEAKTAPELYKAKVQTEKARGEAQKAAATAHRASASNSYASAAKNEKEANQGYPWWEKGGAKHLAKTEEEARFRQEQEGNPILKTNTGGQTTTTTETPVMRSGRPVRDAKGKIVMKKTVTNQQKAGYVTMKPKTEAEKRAEAKTAQQKAAQQKAAQNGKQSQPAAQKTGQKPAAQQKRSSYSNTKKLGL